MVTPYNQIHSNSKLNFVQVFFMKNVKYFYYMTITKGNNRHN